MATAEGSFLEQCAHIYWWWKSLITYQKGKRRLKTERRNKYTSFSSQGKPERHASGFHVKGQNGELFRLYILEHDIFRVTYSPDQSQEIDKNPTWLIAGFHSEQSEINRQSKSETNKNIHDGTTAENITDDVADNVADNTPDNVADNAPDNVADNAPDNTSGTAKRTAKRTATSRTSSYMNNILYGDVPYEGRQRSDYSPFSLPEVEMGKTATGKVRVLTNQITAVFDNTGIMWQDTAGTLAKDKEYGSKGFQVFHRMDAAEYYYGLGESYGPLNKKGKRYRFLNLPITRYDLEKQRTLTKSIPFFIGMNKGRAYGILYDNLAYAKIDAGSSKKKGLLYTAQHGEIDYYFIYGPSIKDVIRKMVKLTGGVHFLPKFSLGYGGKGLAVTDHKYGERALIKNLEMYKKYGISYGLFYLDAGYTYHDGSEHPLIWNNKSISDPKKIIQKYKEQGFRVSGSVKPCMLCSHPEYNKVSSQGLFITNQNGAPLTFPVKGLKGKRWEFNSGIIKKVTGVYLDFSGPNTRAWWRKKLASVLFDKGIAAVWNDYNSYPPSHELPIDLRLSQIGAVQPLLMAKCSYEGVLRAYPDKRPLITTTAALPGSQRYAQIWTGRSFSSWKSMKNSIPMGLSLSLSGMFNFGHDIGGSLGKKPEPELFLRWIQSGIFNPNFTISSHNLEKGINSPWMYQQCQEAVMEAISFRYKMLPFLYSLLFRAHVYGEPIIRPMVYHFQDDDKCRDEAYSFMVGPDIMAAPVLKKGDRFKQVYLPGSGWYDFHTGRYHPGGSNYIIAAPLERIPLFIREGGLLPLYDKEKGLQLHVFPFKTKGKNTFVLFEDDGESWHYLHDGALLSRFTQVSERKRITLLLEQEGRFSSQYKDIELVFPSGLSERRPFTGGKGFEFSFPLSKLVTFKK